VGHSPPDIGGVDATSRRRREASFDGAAGVVRSGTLSKNAFRNDSAILTVCAAKERDLFLDGAATPPISGGEFASLKFFINRPYTRLTICLK
jgi:hypothetical protein